MSAFNRNNGSVDFCEFNPELLLPTWLTPLQLIYLILSLFSSLLLNASFTIIAIMYKPLHQKDTMINLVLTISNICYNVVANIVSIASLTSGRWPFGKSLCYVSGMMILFLALLRYTFLLAITVDRFGSVMYPFRYPRQSTKVVAAVFTIGGLFCAVVALAFGEHSVGCYNFDQYTQRCRSFASCSEIWCHVYISLVVLIIVAFGVVVPFVLSCLLFCKAKKHRQRIACGSEMGTFGNVQMVGSAGATTVTSEDDRRAVVTLVLLLTSIVGLTVPSILLDALFAGMLPGSPASLIGQLIFDLYNLIPTADALIIWRNRDVKERAMYLCRRICKKQ
eukprot:Em0001g1979a